MTHPQFRFIRNSIYKLKRIYSLPITVYRSLTVSSNLNTGEMSQTTLRISINRAIVMPTKQLRQISNTKDFTYGGFYDTSARAIILDHRDLPTDFDITENDYIIFEHARYEIKEINRHEHKECLILIVTRKIGSLAYEIQPVIIRESLNIIDSVLGYNWKFAYITQNIGISDGVDVTVI